jgi:predicted nucleic acid-binding protein
LNRFVLDASVALSWFIDIPVDSYAIAAREMLEQGSRGVVPRLWELEFANGMLVAERRQIVTAVVADANMGKMEQLRFSLIEADEGPVSTRQVLAVARSFRLTVYDASYLELAQREGLPLATLDKRLRAAAAKAGVELVR